MVEGEMLELFGRLVSGNVAAGPRRETEVENLRAAFRRDDDVVRPDVAVDET